MRTRKGLSRRYPILVSLLVLLPLTALTAIAQQSHSQVVYLPDPTPRKTDPNLLYGDNSAGQAAAEQIQARNNAKRRQLVEWGANELVLLSEQLQANVAKRAAGGSLAPNAAGAAKIEDLAKNLKAAMKAQ